MTIRDYRGFRPAPLVTDPESPLVRSWLFPELAPILLLPRLGRTLSEGFDRFVGITSNGTVLPRTLRPRRPDDTTAGIAERAAAFLDTLEPAQLKKAVQPLDSADWLNWFNGVEMPHGFSLRDATQTQREAALNVIRATLSTRGADQVWSAMQLNEVLGEIVGNTAILNKWQYAMTIFGSPSTVAPWGWQFQGHHVCVNCLFIDGQMAMTPHFIGAEPAIVDEGPLKGMNILQEEERNGFALLRALEPEQRAVAIVNSSMLEADLPPGRYVPADQRIQAGALKDNAIIPLEGLEALRMSHSQRSQLMELIELYVSRMPSNHAQTRMKEVQENLDYTNFAWIGSPEPHKPFYYKVHSPVILIEFDHHSGVALDNKTPETFHVHTCVRTPNGGDYGRDLLKEHYRQFHADRRSAPHERRESRRENSQNEHEHEREDGTIYRRRHS